MTVVAVIWSLLYNSPQGVINSIVAGITFRVVREVNWLLNPLTAFPAIMLLSIWQGAGYQMLIFLAGLQSIPAELYEAASIDGATPWQQFWRVTLPQLRNTTIFVFLTTVILAFQLFDQVYVMNTTGVVDRESTVTVLVKMIEQGFGLGRIGVASAIASDSLSTRKRIYAALSYMALVVLAIFFIGPLLFMFTTSAKNDELTLQRELGGISAFCRLVRPANPTRRPTPTKSAQPPPLVRAEGETDQQFRARLVARMCETGIQNFADMNTRVNYWRALFNSTLVVTITVVLGLLVNSMFAYAIARIKFWGREFLITGVISLIIIPFSAVAIPLFLMVVRQFGCSDSYQALIFPLIASAFSIYLFYQFFISLPKELEEAAFVDEADRFRTYWQIVLPLSGPVFATVTVLQFLALWANLLWPVMVVRGLDSPVATLPYVMQTFFGQAPRQWGDVMAFALCTTLPTLLLFLFFQRWFVRSVVSSGVKG